MNKPIEDLKKLFKLEPAGENEFQGFTTYNMNMPRLFGGQVLGQALAAAQLTIEDQKNIHSLNGYFLRPGNPDTAINYKVEITRNGKSFSSRRVVAMQNEKPIFTLAASFQIEETGLEFQHVMPDVPRPEELESVRGNDEKTGIQDLSERVYRLLQPGKQFELKPVKASQIKSGSNKTVPHHCLWLKTATAMPDSPGLHNEMLTFVSDYGLLAAAFIPHGIHLSDAGLQVASLDHAMWFHRPFRMDEWLLYVCEATSTSGSRGLTRGSFFREDGALVATTTQEGLIRER